MKPGATIRSATSTVRADGPAIACPIRTISSPRIATSARYQGLPAPSRTRPLRRTRSYGAPAGSAAAPRPKARAATRTARAPGRDASGSPSAA